MGRTKIKTAELEKITEKLEKYADEAAKMGKSYGHLQYQTVFDQKTGL